jgi:hypothetical protein
VFFDATGTTGLSGLDYVGANWTWDFGDPASPHRGTVGFNVAHVFDNPGTYNVSTRVQDVTGNSGSTMTTITVTKMSGTTYYVASSGSDTNNGTSTSTPFQTVAHALSVGSATNNSIRLRNNDTFKVGSSQTAINVTGPFLIGGYSDPMSPSTVAPIWSSSSTGGLIAVNGTDDRITDLHVIAAAAGGGIASTTGGLNALLERVEMEQTGSGEAMTSSTNTGPYFYVVDCNFHDSGGYGYYGAAPTGVIVIGTTFAKFTTTANHHMIRVQGANPIGSAPQAGAIYIAENTFTPILPYTTDGFNSVTIRGDSINFVLVNNYLTTVMNLESGQNALVEGNTFINNISPFDIESKHVVARNNLFTGAPDGGPDVGILVTVDGLRATNWVDQIYVYNNTQYTYHSGTYANPDIFVQHKVTTGSLTAVNNILSTGNQGAYSHVVDTDGAGTDTYSHNLIYSPNSGGALNNPYVGAGGVVQQNPLFVSTDLSSPNAFQLSPGSPAVNAGMMVPVYGDFTRNVTRPQGAGWDIGAFELPQQAGSDAGLAQDASAVAAAAVLSPAQGQVMRKGFEKPPVSR